jgi:hypothetical protein
MSPHPPASLASAVIVSTTALASKAFLSLSTQAYDVRGVNHLTSALNAERAPVVKGNATEPLGDGGLPRRGIVTSM